MPSVASYLLFDSTLVTCRPNDIFLAPGYMEIYFALPYCDPATCAPQVIDPGLSVQEIKSGQLEIFPNPTDHSVTVKGEMSLNDMTIYDLNGKKVIDVKSGSSSEIIDLSAL